MLANARPIRFLGSFVTGGVSRRLARLRRPRANSSIVLLAVFCLVGYSAAASAQDADNSIWMDYLEGRVSSIEARSRDFEPGDPESRRQLLEMLGLDPLPPRTPLLARTTGTVERDGVVVEKLHFQSLPGLYVTANLYRPAVIEAPCPAVLYLCGHGGVKENGVSYGNKVHYQHHGFWMASHGFICLTIDSLQLGEIEAIHHGTYRYDRWWWLGRGYTPAGVEAWNCLRSIDYLLTRDDVDETKLACTGRSGGGAYSWWIASIDPRIACAAPVAGITDLRDHVVEGCVEGHCDCMYMVNTYLWDYPQVAAMVAPRPLLIVNTDRDSIFPLAGVNRTYGYLLPFYERANARESLGLSIGPGPHEDTQNLQVPAFRWMRTHLQGDTSSIDDAAVKRFTPEELRVFTSLPPDEINTRIDETFVPAATTINVAEAEDVDSQLTAWRQAIDQRVLRPWQDRELGAPIVNRRGTSHGWSEWEVRTDGPLTCRLLVTPVPREAKGVRLIIVKDAEQFEAAWRLSPEDTWVVGCLPRGTSGTTWAGSESSLNQFHRRLYLIGETLAAGQVWDIRQSLDVLRESHEQEVDESAWESITLVASAEATWTAALTAIQEPAVSGLELHGYPLERDARPALLNIDRHISPVNLLCLAGERCELLVSGLDESARATLEQWGRDRSWPEDRLQLIQE